MNVFQELMQTLVKPGLSATQRYHALLKLTPAVTDSLALLALSKVKTCLRCFQPKISLRI